MGMCKKDRIQNSFFSSSNTVLKNALTAENMSFYLLHLLICFAVYFLLAASFVGWGRIVSKFFGIGFSASERFFGYIWLGWALSLFLLQAWHLFRPIDVYASAMLYGLGLLAFFRYLAGGRLGKIMAAIRPRLFWIMVPVLAIVWWIASRSMLPPYKFDSGLYHFSSIRWLNEYAIVPGLGNLHGRLAFNQSFFAYVASLNLYPEYIHGHNFANSFLLIVLLAECVYSVVGSTSDGTTKFIFNRFLMALFLPVLMYCGINSSLASPYPDTTSFLIQVLLFIYFWRLLEFRRMPQNCASRSRFLILMAVCLITIKLSNLAYCVLIAGIAAWMCFRCFSGSIKKLAVKMGPTALLAAAFLIIWMIRGGILSGYPLYPVSFLRIDADWTVPVWKAQDEANWIYSWARQPGSHWKDVLGNWNWLGLWLNNIAAQKIEVIYPLIMSLIVLLLHASNLLLMRMRKAEKVNLMSAVSLMPVICGLIFWFFTAPDPRFAGALFWILPIAAIVVLLSNIKSKELRPVLFGVMFLAVAAPFTVWLSSNPWKLKMISTVGFYKVKSVDLIEKTTLSGLTIYVPATEEQCWYSPLPSTPYFNPRLRLRGSTIQSGFALQKEGGDS